MSLSTAQTSPQPKALFDPRMADAFDRLIRLSTRLLDVPVAWVGVLENDRLVLPSHQGLPDGWVQSEGVSEKLLPFYTLVASSPLTTAVSDLRADSRFEAKEIGVQALLGQPLSTSGSQSIGVIVVMQPQPRSWSQDEIDTLRDLAASAMAEIDLWVRCRESERLEAQLREEARATQTLYRLGSVLSAELDLQTVVQNVTDAATELTRADFGAFFYNVLDVEGESYMLYTLSGVPAEAFSKFPMPRNTLIFDPTFRGAGVVRIDDVTRDPRYGKNPPYNGMPEGHLPVRSYLAVPVISRSGGVHGGLFFGHSAPGVFTEHDEQVISNLAAHAAVAMDNAMLFEAVQRQRTQAEANEEQQRSMAEALPQLVWTARPNGQLDYYNRRWVDYTGLTPDESRGEAWRAVVHPDDRRMCVDRWRDSVKTGKTYEVEYRLRRFDGAYRWFLGRAVPILEGEGQVIKWLGTCTDIDDQKRAEEAQLFLAEASTILSSSFDSRETFNRLAHLIVPLLGDWCTIDTIEDGAIRRLAVAHMDVTMEDRAWELWRKYPTQLEDAGELLSALSSGRGILLPEITDEGLQEISRNADHLEVLRSLKIRSGLIVPLFARGRVQGGIGLYSAESGRTYGPEDLAFAEELAHRAAIAMDNARLFQEIQRADRAKDEFLAMLGHELRNPLSPILNALHIMRLREMDASTQEKTREVIERQVHHMARLIDQLLNVTRIAQGKIDLRFERLDLVALATEVMEDHRSTIEGAGLTLSLDMPEEPVWVEADLTRLSQVLGNLVQNAVKFTPSGGAISLRVRAQPEKGRVNAILQDTGIGLEPEMLPRIFDPFTQADRSLDRSRGGLGLGLALVKGLVELHNGEVAVRSEGQGKGAEFSFWLPLQTADVGIEKTSELRFPSPAHRRILIIEDNPDAAESLRDVLELWGHQVEVANTGRTGLVAARRFQPEVVLCDIGLPEMDGYAVARELRKDPSANGRLLISISGYGQQEDRRQSEEAGFNLHLTKPVDPDQLQRELQK